MITKIYDVDFISHINGIEELCHIPFFPDFQQREKILGNFYPFIALCFS